MSNSVEMSPHLPLVRRLVRWWHNWRKNEAAVAELNCCGTAEVERMAHDVGVNTSDLRILAGKWPDAAEALTQRMGQLALNLGDVMKTEPQVIQDLQRVCTLCRSKGRCEHDLAQNPSDPVWQDYCPNVMTLKALVAERHDLEPK